MLPIPPASYSAARPRFQFRALAAQVGRAPLGEERVVALACLVGARLAAGVMPPLGLGASARAARASGARAWLGAHALPAIPRSALARLVDASVADDRGELAAALRAVMAASRSFLDAGSLAELNRLAVEVYPVALRAPARTPSRPVGHRSADPPPASL